MRFIGWNLDAQGNRLEQKLTFFVIARDTVRQLFEQSSDGGKSWKPTFDGRYVRRRQEDAGIARRGSPPRLPRPPRLDC